MLYSIDLAFTLPKTGFDRLVEAIDALHRHVSIHVGNDGRLFHYNSAKEMGVFMRDHEDPVKLKHCYDLMPMNNYVYMPLGIYAHLAFVNKNPHASNDQIAMHLEDFIQHHLMASSGFRKKQTAHMFSHLYGFLEVDNRHALSNLMGRLLTFTPRSEDAHEIKKERREWVKRLEVFCPGYAYELFRESGVCAGIERYFGNDEVLCNWVKNTMPSRLRMDFMKAMGREELLMQALTSSGKRSMLSEGLGL